MKKRFLLIISLVLALVLCISCAPSGDNGDSSNANSTTAAQTTTVAAKDSFLNGVELSKYSIVYSYDDLDYSERAAKYIQSEILARTELELPLIDDSSKNVSEYEIIVGETSRDISSRLDADTEGMQFAILAEEKQIALEGDYFIIAAAAYFFIENYVPEDNVSASVPEGLSIHEPITEKADNHIILIGDGMGKYQTLLFDYLADRTDYSDKEDLFYGYLFPYQGLCRTLSLSGVTDSAAAGTALACGTKTINRYVGLNFKKQEIQSITELAASLGKSTAVMSTEASTGAIPRRILRSHARPR